MTRVILLTLLSLSLVSSTFPIPYGPTVKTFDTKLDHYSSNGQSTTFKIRYIIDGQYWDSKNGPILFYSGNEGNIWTFYNNAGFVTTTLAKELKGLVVFGEHRYFGESFPFPKDTAFNKTNNVYLTVEQAMMDYVELLKYIRYNYNAMHRPCIAFGGSYGGMLAAWLRMKFPATFQGALASSAPLVWFKGQTSFKATAFGDVVGMAYWNNSDTFATCYNSIKEGIQSLVNVRNNDNLQDFQEIDTIFHTCDDTKVTQATDMDKLQSLIYSAYNMMAMLNYPYEASFINHMPGNPVAEACRRVEEIMYSDDLIKKQSDFKNLNQNRFKQERILNVGQGDNPMITDEMRLMFKAIYNSTRVFFDYDNKEGYCTNLTGSTTGNLDAEGWYVLACNQLTMPVIYGSESIFIEQDTFDYGQYTSQCEAKYGLTPRFDFVFDYFGGSVVKRDFLHASNIIFSNGYLDPWYPGGMTVNATSADWKSTAILIDKAAHHLDLRLPNEQFDPVEVKNARDQELTIIKKWIETYNASP